MMTLRSTGSPGWQRWPLVVAAMLLAAPALGDDGGNAGAAASPPAASRAPAATTESQREAAAVLNRMTAYLAGLRSFSVRLRNGYDVVQSTGQKIEFGETRTLTLARPDRLRVEEVASDGTRDLAIFDGRNMTVLNADTGVYAQVAQPGTVDDALVYFVRDLRMRMPLAVLLTTRLAAELPARVKVVEYVEDTDIYGKPAQHIAGRLDSVDFQFWIAEGERPLPLRVVITYADAPGQPQFWTDFSNWNTAPEVTNATFGFTPPKGARRVPFAVQVPRSGSAPEPAAVGGEVAP